jgi:hypothetical protein
VAAQGATVAGGLDPVAVLHPPTDVVDTVVLARVPG